MELKAKTTIDEAEVAKFSAIADEWWDERGKFAPLHKINPLRVEWIREQITGMRHEALGKSNNTTHASGLLPLASIQLLDIGCGGGLICEPMARLGANVTGIDASEKNIKVASLHAEKMGLDIRYECTSAESLVLSLESLANNTKDYRLSTTDYYDVVTALEIIEHVADIPAFVEATCKLVKQGGLIFYSTLNRTPKAYALAIIGAEYVLRWLPRGTHDWNKFVKPHELVRELEKNNIEIIDMRGMVMNPLTFTWSWSNKDLSVNYALVGRKKA